MVTPLLDALVAMNARVAYAKELRALFTPRAPLAELIAYEYVRTSFCPCAVRVVEHTVEIGHVRGILGEVLKLEGNGVLLARCREEARELLDDLPRDQEPFFPVRLYSVIPRDVGFTA